jgi:hypothetical protein
MLKYTVYRGFSPYTKVGSQMKSNKAFYLAQKPFSFERS